MPSNHPISAEQLIAQQLLAYNAHDVDALLATYAADAQQFEHPGKLLASGHAQIHARMVARFEDPALHAQLLKRTVMGNVVTDHEAVTRSTAQGVETVELVAIYVLQQGLIQSSSVAFIAA